MSPFFQSLNTSSLVVGEAALDGTNALNDNTTTPPTLLAEKEKVNMGEGALDAIITLAEVSQLHLKTLNNLGTVTILILRTRFTLITVIISKN